MFMFVFLQLLFRVCFLKQSWEHLCLLQNVIKKGSLVNSLLLWLEFDSSIVNVAKEEKELMTVSELSTSTLGIV